MEVRPSLIIRSLGLRDFRLHNSSILQLAACDVWTAVREGSLKGSLDLSVALFHMWHQLERVRSSSHYSDSVDEGDACLLPSPSQDPHPLQLVTFRPERYARMFPEHLPREKPYGLRRSLLSLLEVNRLAVAW